MGFNSYWLPQQVDLDALMVAPRLSMAAPALEIGVGVVPMQSRFPVHMAQAARTADFLSPGPFTLGLGVEHDWVVRDMWGLPFDRPVTEMTEYLRVVLDLLRNGASQHQGDFYRVSTFTSRLPPAPRLPVLLGALGPRMLDLAGSVADGTITWLAGVETVTSHIVPRVTAAAERAERPTTRIVVILPVAVTDEPDRVAEEIDTAFDLFTHQRSYQTTMARENATRPSQVSIIGTARHVSDQLARLEASGVTDFVAIRFGSDSERERTTNAITSPT